MNNLKSLQRKYTNTLETLDALKALTKQYDQSWLKQNNLASLKTVYAIDNDTIFEKWASEAGIYEESIGLYVAEDLKKQAETNLIQWGLRHVKKDLPAGIYEALLSGMKILKRRQEFINLTMKLSA